MRYRWLIIVVALVLGAVTACGPGSGSEPNSRASGDRSSPDALADRAGPPAGVDATPVATGPEEATLTDELIIAARYVDGNCGLVARALADPAQPRWVFDRVDDVILRCSADPVLIAGTTIVDAYIKVTPAQGIQPAGFDRGLVGIGFDGKIRWRTAAGDLNTVVAANDRFVLGQAVEGISDPNLPGRVSEPAPKIGAAVVDTNTGKLLWQRPDLAARALDGDTVYASDATSTLQALDAATGTVRWTAPKLGRYTPMFAIAGVVLQATHRPLPGYQQFENTVTIRNGQTGAVLHEERDTALGGCVSDGRSAIVCQYDDDKIIGPGSLYAVDLHTGQRLWGIPAEQADAAKIVLRSMVDGRVFVSTTTGGALLDAATGKQLASGLTAAPSLVRGAYGVVNGDRRQYTVYRVTG
jgi:PQQ-like domain